MYGIDQRQCVCAVVDPCDEAAEHLEADHSGQWVAFDVAERIQRKNDKELVLQRGIADVELIDVCKPAFHDAFAGACAGQTPFDLETQLLDDWLRDDVVAAGVEYESERPFAVDFDLAKEVIADDLDGDFRFYRA